MCHFDNPSLPSRMLSGPGQVVLCQPITWALPFRWHSPYFITIPKKNGKNNIQESDCVIEELYLYERFFISACNLK